MKQGLVRNWMSSPIRSITPQTRLDDARKIINAEGIRHLPVIEHGKAGWHYHPAWFTAHRSFRARSGHFTKRGPHERRNHRWDDDT